MNKAFIAICFWQSLPDLPPLGRHVPLTAFYRLVKAEELRFMFSHELTKQLLVSTICACYVEIIIIYAKTGFVL